MSTPGHGGRAPLLWLLLPGAAGIAATRVVPTFPGDLILPAGAVLLGALLALRAAMGSQAVARRVWAGAIVGGAFLAGFAHARRITPAADLRGGSPAREVQATVRIVQAFAPAPRARSLTGIGEIVTAPETFPQLQGERIYFATLRRINVTPPLRQGVYRIRGVLSAPAPPSARRGFDDYLHNLGVVARLERGFVEAQIAGPGWSQEVARNSARRFAGYLRVGLDRRPELASVLVAMLLGEKAALSPEQESAFMRSGTYHIFSVSGLHVGVIAIAIQSLLLLFRVPRLLRVVLGLGALWFYVQVVGANPPAVRAFIMVAFFLARGLFGLPGNPVAALTAAALVTLLLDPRQLFSSGFQLSYLVVGAIVLMGIPLSARWLDAWRPFAALPDQDLGRLHRLYRWAGRKFLGALAITLTALLGSTPATIAAFGLFTPAGLLANLVIVPLASLTIIAGFISILSGLLGVPSWCALFNHAAALLIALMDGLVRHGTALPLAYFQAEFRAAWQVPLGLCLPLALMLVGAASGWRRKTGGYWLPAAGVFVLLLACVRLTRG